MVFSIFALTMMGFSSCFDFVEEVDMNRNGSGTIKATFNLSKSRTKVATLLKLDKVDGIKIPKETEIRQEMNDIFKLLRSTPGITNVKQTLDFNNYIATLSCDFTDITALNSFTKTLNTHFKTNISNYSSYNFDPKSKVFTRSYTYNAEAKKGLDKLKTESQKSFSDAYFTSIFRFQDNVAKQTSTLSKVAASNKAVMVKVSALDLAKGKVNLSNKITLK